MLGENDGRHKIKIFLDENFDGKRYHVCKECNIKPCELYKKPYVCQKAGLRVIEMPEEHIQNYRIKCLPRKEKSVFGAQFDK